MPKSSDSTRRRVSESARRLLKVNRKDSRALIRIVVGTLAVFNVAAALIVFKPWGGSPEDLARQLEELRRQVVAREAALSRTKALVEKVEKARTEGDRFLAEYVMNRRTAASTIVSELSQMAGKSGIKPKEAGFTFEPIEGSDTLSMMTVAAGFEGTYQNLTQFINLLDKSPRFLIIESLQAAPQQSGATLNVMLKFNTFVRDQAGHALQQAVAATANRQEAAAQ